MIYVEDIKYKNVHDKSYKQQRLPILQSGNDSSIITILQTKYDKSEISEIKHYLSDIRSKHVVSINCIDGNVSKENDIYVRFYQNTTEIAKAKLVNMVMRYKELDSNIIERLLEYDYFLDSLFTEKNVKEEIVKTIAGAIGELSSCECVNLLEALDWLESNDEMKEILLQLVMSLNDINEYGFDMMCDFKELKEFADSSPIYFKYFIKEIQFQLHATGLNTCVGVSDVERSVLPIFDLAGVCNNIFEAKRYVLVPEYKDILRDLLNYKINDESDFNCALSSAVRFNCAENYQLGIQITMHELASVLLNSKIAFKNNLYQMVVRKATEN